MMINTVEALQGLYVALGGELSNVANITTIPEMLTAISSVAAAAASELPVVTASDNGKVLGVVNGAWAKKTPVDCVNGSIFGSNYSTGLKQNELYDLCDKVYSGEILMPIFKFTYVDLNTNGAYSPSIAYGGNDKYYATLMHRESDKTVYFTLEVDGTSTQNMGNATVTVISDPTAEG